MSRYRPPRPPSSKYVTPEGYAALQAELNGLWARRAEVVKALAAAAAEGDRSENAEYIYRKKELRGIDSRIRFLQKRLPDLKVVETKPTDPERVYFGAWVELEAEDGTTRLHRIVGPDEFDRDPRYVSMDAPLARALMGKRLDDEVEVQLPKGTARFFIIDVRYGRRNDD